MIFPKDYLGDGVYAEYDGHHIVLTTENDRWPSNIIALEGSVYEALMRYVARVQAANEQSEKARKA